MTPNCCSEILLMNPTDTKPDFSKNRSRGWSDDMSTEAIKQRLETVAQLYQLWLGLKNAKLIGPVNQPTGISLSKSSGL